ncbi:diphthine--ammonia ligase [Lentibacillus saliphilus]|uniref:Dph6-related ATP pyrophosphatase n=1 Tax=Lentibacillus saliphilus TaxID=2737028 RepID=UPI001FE52869|nr:diphthine--ammonia ligase [Lentibacillus saliphilus]
MKRTALSFSGGKDSSFALYKLKQQGIEVACLVTTVFKQDDKTVAHGDAPEHVIQQAERLGIPVTFVYTDFESYNDDYLQHLLQLKQRYKLDAIAFGDIYLDGHREWGEKLAEKAGLEARYPLWTTEDQALPLLHEFISQGFKARVIKVDQRKLPSHWVGRLVDTSFANDIAELDVCPMGEAGEYHTVVEDGPCFNRNK